MVSGDTSQPWDMDLGERGEDMNFFALIFDQLGKPEAPALPCPAPVPEV